jgi:hypothetical protein
MVMAEHFIFVSFEEKSKGVAITLLAGFNYSFIDKLFSHYHRCLDAGLRWFLPKRK